MLSYQEQQDTFYSWGEQNRKYKHKQQNKSTSLKVETIDITFTIIMLNERRILKDAKITKLSLTVHNVDDVA